MPTFPLSKCPSSRCRGACRALPGYPHPAAPVAKATPPAALLTVALVRRRRGSAAVSRSPSPHARQEGGCPVLVYRGNFPISWEFLSEMGMWEFAQKLGIFPRKWEKYGIIIRIFPKRQK